MTVQPWPTWSISSAVGGRTYEMFVQLVRELRVDPLRLDAEQTGDAGPVDDATATQSSNARVTTECPLDRALSERGRL